MYYDATRQGSSNGLNFGSGLGMMASGWADILKQREDAANKKQSKDGNGGMWGGMTPYQYYMAPENADRSWFDITLDKASEMFGSGGGKAGIGFGGMIGGGFGF